MHPDLQNLVVKIFNRQEASFRAGVNTVVPFDGRWTPDEDEMLAIDIPVQAVSFCFDHQG